MKFLAALLLGASVAYALVCGDASHRCKNPDTTVTEMDKVTIDICNELETDTCYCDNWDERYCDPFGDDVAKFKKQCEQQGEGWYWAEYWREC